MLIIPFEGLPSSACSKRSGGPRVSQLLLAFTVSHSYPYGFSYHVTASYPPSCFSSINIVPRHQRFLSNCLCIFTSNSICPNCTYLPVWIFSLICVQKHLVYWLHHPRNLGVFHVSSFLSLHPFMYYAFCWFYHLNIFSINHCPSIPVLTTALLGTASLPSHWFSCLWFYLREVHVRIARLVGLKHS